MQYIFDNSGCLCQDTYPSLCVLIHSNAYDVYDELVVFTELEYFKVFYNDEVYELESYTPENYQIKDATLAYINVNGWLKAFVEGKQSGCYKGSDTLIYAHS